MRRFVTEFGLCSETLGELRGQPASVRVATPTSSLVNDVPTPPASLDDERLSNQHGQPASVRMATPASLLVNDAPKMPIFPDR